MGNLLLLLLLWLGPEPLVVIDTVDVCELNHVYADDGSHTFTQVVWWRDNGERFEVVAWKIVKDGEPHIERGQALWWDNGLRQVKAKHYRERWSQYDVELYDREILPADQRKGLGRGMRR